jgi:hypothetical protein
MRLSKMVWIAAAACALLPSPCAAQRAGRFENSWFWGVKGGVNTFSTGNSASASVPTWGLDWMITRTNGGLYVSADQSFFSRTVSRPDDTSPGGTRNVRVQDMRRVDFAGMVFPTVIGSFRPYAGVGAALSLFGSAVAQTDSVGGTPGQRFLDRTESERSRASLLIMAGAQVQARRAAIFVQETILPSGQDFLVRSGMSFFEICVRYNFGSSIDSSR